MRKRRRRRFRRRLRAYSLNISHHLGKLSWALAGRLLPPLSGLILLATILPTLTVAEYGRYNLIYYIALQIIFLNKSLVLHPMIKFGSEPGRFERVCGLGMGLSLAASATGGLIGIALSPVIAKVLRVETMDVVLASLLPMALWFRDWGFCAQQTIYKTGRLFAVEAVYHLGFALGCILIWIEGDGDAGDVLKANFVAALASSVVALALKPAGIRLIRGTIAEMFGIIRYGCYTLGIGVSANLLAGADILIIGAIYNPETVGIYAGAKRIYAVASTLISTVGLLVMPYASRLAGEERRTELTALFEKSIGYGIVVMSALAAAAFFLIDPFYRYVLPEQYLASAPLLKILIFAAPLEAIYTIGGSLLYGIGAATAVAAGSSYGLAVMALTLPAGAYLFSLPGAAVAQVVGAGATALILGGKAMRESGATAGSILRRVSVGIGSLLKGGR